MAVCNGIAYTLSERVLDADNSEKSEVLGEVFVVDFLGVRIMRALRRPDVEVLVA